MRGSGKPAPPPGRPASARYQGEWGPASAAMFTLGSKSISIPRLVIKVHIYIYIYMYIYIYIL